ncbi:MAG: hypothetical protein ACI4WS_07795 [Oscillospiraceae bacterium]
MYKGDEQSEYPEGCSTESGALVRALRAEPAKVRLRAGSVNGVAAPVSRVKGSRGFARSEVEQR